MDFKKKIDSSPDACGVYIMKSLKGDVVYIGKAVSIRKRLYSHYRRSGTGQGAVWLGKVSGIEYILCNTEEQALILEASLIKEKRPRYNVALRDDKSFPYVVFSEDLYPRVYVSRMRGEITGRVRGPFVNVALIKSVLKLIRKVFPFRSCAGMPKKACLYYHLDMCAAPCIGKVEVASYQEVVDNVYKIISGQRKEHQEKLNEQMIRLAEEM